MKESDAIPNEENQVNNQVKRPKRLIGIKMMLFGKIIVPLIIGILITSFITMFFIYMFNPIWIKNSSIFFDFSEIKIIK